jgi:hypothetical protein
MEKKRCKVVMLPTDKAQDSIVDCSNRLQYFKGFFTQEYLKSQGKSSHYLYITSDDKIEEGDWYIVLADEELHKHQGKSTSFVGGKKIIATTDSKLKIKDFPELDNSALRVLPQIPQEFIEEYCLKGGIDEVDVEGELFWEVNGVVLHEYLEPLNPQKDDKQVFIPKVDSHNTINIHPIKDTWTRGEVYKIAKVAYRMGAQNHEDATIERFDKFIKENL